MVFYSIRNSIKRIEHHLMTVHSVYNDTGFRSSSNGIQWSQSSLVLYTYISKMSDFGVKLHKILTLKKSNWLNLSIKESH